MSSAGVSDLLGDHAPPHRAEVVIVGAGIAGLAAALELARRGVRDIVIVDRSYPGSGATGRNVARIRAMQLTEDLCRVASACQAKYEAIADELRFNVLFYRMGYAWILYDPDEVRRMRDIVDMHHRIGIRSSLLDPEAVLEAVPAFRGGEPVAGGVIHDDGIVHHDAVVWAYLEALARTDVAILTRTAVTAVECADDGVRGVVTSRGRIETRVVLNAAGGWSNMLDRLAGLRAPNRPYRREVLVTAPVQRFIDKAVTFYRPVEGWFNQTLRGEVVMGVVDPNEPAGHEQRSSWDFLKRTATLMTRKAPVLGDLTVIRQWAGMYDVTPDHLPRVGPTRHLDGWWEANGWSGRGMLLAPYLGQLLAERFVSGTRSSMLDMFDPDRFGTAGEVSEDLADYYARYRSRAS